MRLLLVEDDAALRGVMLLALTSAGHRVDVARTLDEARHWWQVQPFDAVLLDLNIPTSPRPHSPQGNGLTVLREARGRGDRTPVLILTARNRSEERVAGLDAGADDYLGKPFDLPEVEARLRALVRRAQGTDDRVVQGQLVLDRKARRFFLHDQPWDLPAREFEVLWELMTPPGRVVSKRVLSDRLSATDDALGDNALEAFISRLRKKLAGCGVSIRTLRGLGYVLEMGEGAPAGASSGAPDPTAKGTPEQVANTRAAVQGAVTNPGSKAGIPQQAPRRRAAEGRQRSALHQPHGRVHGRLESRLLGQRHRLGSGVALPVLEVL